MRAYTELGARIVAIARAWTNSGSARRPTLCARRDACRRAGRRRVTRTYMSINARISFGCARAYTRLGALRVLLCARTGLGVFALELSGG